MEDVDVGLRREAARRRLAGESPEVIARELGRTRQWVAKWAARYDPHDAGWAHSRSRAPTCVAHRTAAEIETQVLEVRGRLEANVWAQGRRAGDRMGATEARRDGAAAAHDRADPQACRRDGPTATRPAGVQGPGVPGANGQPGR